MNLLPKTKLGGPPAIVVVPRDPDVIRAAGAILGALWVTTPFKAGAEWEARADTAIEEAERLVAAYDARGC